MTTADRVLIGVEGARGSRAERNPWPQRPPSIRDGSFLHDPNRQGHRNHLRGLALVGEAVAHAANCVNERSRRAELLTQSLEMSVYGPMRDRDITAPDFFQ